MVSADDCASDSSSDSELDWCKCDRRPAAAIGSAWAFWRGEAAADLAALKGVLDMMRADDVQTARAVGLRQDQLLEIGRGLGLTSTHG